MPKHKARKPHAGHWVSARIRETRDLLVSWIRRDLMLRLLLKPDGQKRLAEMVYRAFTDRARHAHRLTAQPRGRPDDTGGVSREEFTAYYAAHPNPTVWQVMNHFTMDERTVRRYESRCHLPPASHRRKKRH